MAKTQNKRYFLAVMQLPLALVRLLLSTMQLLISRCENRLTRCHLYLAKRSLVCGAEGEGGRPESVALPDPSVQYGGREIAKRFIDQLSDHDEDFVDAFRRQTEETTLGRIVAAKHPDRRLYAVLQPDYLENLRRVQNILDEIPTHFLPRMVKTLEEKIFIMEYRETMKGPRDEPV